MEKENQTSMTNFILRGLSDDPELYNVLAVIFLIVYLVTIIGNFTILSVIIVSPKLHTSMYFFLCSLSMVDICLINITIPKLLTNLFSGQKAISVYGCFMQMFFFHSIGNMDSFLLALMSFDRYVAICNPMHYHTIMSWRLCVLLVAICWIIVALHGTLFTVMTSSLSFCGSKVIQHFFCDVPPMLKLSCSSTYVNEMVIFLEGSLIVMGPMTFILISYIRIIASVLKIQTSKGRGKAFSTCVSHLTAVSLFYSTVIFMYFRPLSSHSIEYDRTISVVHSIGIPMVNPFIYSLRNKEVKESLRRVWLKLRK